MHVVGQKPADLAAARHEVRDTLAGPVAVKQHAFERHQPQPPGLDVVEHGAGAQPCDRGLRIQIGERACGPRPAPPSCAGSIR